MPRSVSRHVFLIALAMQATAHAQVLPDPAWVESACKLVPQGYVGGAAIRTDTTTITGYLAVFRERAADPKNPASAFDCGHIFVTKLASKSGSLNAVPGELREHKPESDTELGTDGKPRRRARLVAQAPFKSGEELQLRTSIVSAAITRIP